MTDLNDLIPANASLHLLTTFGINDAGEIVGFGVTNPGALQAFLATPCTADKSPTGHSAVSAHSAAECFRETQQSANTKSSWANESDRETETRLSTEKSAWEVIFLLTSDPSGTFTRTGVAGVATIQELSLLGGGPVDTSKPSWSDTSETDCGFYPTPARRNLEFFSRRGC
jgi:hypothetical protein